MAVEASTIVITRTLNAPLARVWQVWTDPKEIVKWWGPKGFTCPSCTIDFKVGGKFLYCMRGPAGTEFDKDMWSGGTFKEIIPMKKIVATDHFTDAEGNVMTPEEFGMPGEWPDEEMVVTTEFSEPEPGKTVLTITHYGHPKGEMTEGATAGWNESIDKFVAAL